MVGLPGAGEGKGVGSYCLMSFSLGNEEVLEIDSDDGCITMLMYLIPQNCTLKMVNKYYVVYFTTIKKYGELFILLW